MDNFIEYQCSSAIRRKYWIARIHCYLTETFAGGSYRVAAIYWVVLRAIIIRLFWKVLWRMQCGRATAKSENFLMVLCTSLLLLRAWRKVTGSLTSRRD